jgi:hypothetical protein
VAWRLLGVGCVMHRIRGVPKFETLLRYPNWGFSWFPSVSPGKCWDSSSKWATAAYFQNYFRFIVQIYRHWMIHNEFSLKGIVLKWTENKSCFQIWGYSTHLHYFALCSFFPCLKSSQHILNAFGAGGAGELHWTLPSGECHYGLLSVIVIVQQIEICKI